MEYIYKIKIEVKGFGFLAGEVGLVQSRSDKLVSVCLHRKSERHVQMKLQGSLWAEPIPTTHKKEP